MQLLGPQTPGLLQGQADVRTTSSWKIARTHSQSAKKVEPNREYKTKRAALGDNPSKEEMDTVVAYGLQQHKKNFPHLYSE